MKTFHVHTTASCDFVCQTKPEPLTNGNSGVYQYECSSNGKYISESKK